MEGGSSGSGVPGHAALPTWVMVPLDPGLGFTTVVAVSRTGRHGSEPATEPLSHATPRHALVSRHGTTSRSSQ